MRLLLVPHAETEWNALGRFQGHFDTSLNERGRRQAHLLQQQMAEEPLKAIVASDLRRALETAEILAQPRGLGVQAEPRLRELHFGEWEGLTYGEVQERTPNTLADWENDPLRASPPGGERLTSLVQRLQDFLHDLTGHVPPSPLVSEGPGVRGESSAILLVAHRGSLRVLLCLLLDRPVERHWEFRLDLASLSEVEIVAGRAVLLRLNETPLGCEVRHGR
jgi:broad specificity phosphatase PhoE